MFTKNLNFRHKIIREKFGCVTPAPPYIDICMVLFFLRKILSKIWTFLSLDSFFERPPTLPLPPIQKPWSKMIADLSQPCWDLKNLNHLWNLSRIVFRKSSAFSFSRFPKRHFSVQGKICTILTIIRNFFKFPCEKSLLTTLNYFQENFL